jgi:hypothetical protein
LPSGEPASDRAGLARIEPASLQPDGDEDVLKDILGLTFAAEQTDADAVQFRRGAAVQ